MDIIYGLSGSGKSEFVHDKILENIKNNEKCILVVSEQYGFTAEKRLLDKTDHLSGATCDVLTFSAMSRQISSDASLKLSKATMCMLVYKAFLANKDKLSYFKIENEAYDLCSEIADIFDEFKRYGVIEALFEDISTHDISHDNAKNVLHEDTPFDDTQTIDFSQEDGEIGNIPPDDISPVNALTDSITPNDISLNDKATKSKISDLKLIYKSFSSYTEKRGLVFESHLEKICKELDKKNHFANTHIYIDQFLDFLPLEYEVIKRLSESAKSLTITLTADKNLSNTEIFSKGIAAFGKLKDIESEQNRILNTIYLDKEYRLNGKADLLFLRDNLTNYKQISFPGSSERISLFEGSNFKSEIVHIAGEILHLCRNDGLRFKDIGIVVSDIEEYTPLITSIFALYQIPVFNDKKTNLSSHPLVLFINNILECIRSDFKYNDIFSYLKSGFSPISHRNTSKIENFCLGVGIRKCVWLNDDKWNKKMRDYYGDDEQKIEEISAIRQEIIKPFIVLKSSMPRSKTAKDIGISLYEFLDNIGLSDRLSEYIDVFKQNGDLNLADEYRQSWDKITNILDEITNAFGDERIGLERFAETFLIGIKCYEVGTIPTSLDAVSVGTLSRSKMSDIKVLFVAGMTADKFPMKPPSEGILNDDDRINLQNQNICLAPDTKKQVFDKHYLIYKLCSIASEKIYLSYALSDLENRSTVPSIVVKRVKELFPSLKITNDLTGISSLSETDVLNLIPTHKTAFLNTLLYENNLHFKPFSEEIYRIFEEDNKTELISFINNARQYDNSAITLKNAKDLFYSDKGISVSMLEKYSACYYSFFLQYGLRLREREKFEFSMPDMGSLMHKALEIWTKKMEERHISYHAITTDEIKELLDEIFPEIINIPIIKLLSDTKRTDYLLGRIKLGLLKAVIVMVEHIKAGQFEPYASELSFSDESDFKPIKFTLPSGEVIKLRGVIDRLDYYDGEDGKYFRIIDYKSGSKSFDLSRIYNGLDLQLFVYAKAVEENTDRAVSGILYFKIGEKKITESHKKTEQTIATTNENTYKMDGLVSSEPSLISAMDNNIIGASKVIPVTLKKDGTPNAYSKVASFDEFYAIKKYTLNYVKKLTNSIFDGKIDISPIKIGAFSPCTYCTFESVCRFDSSFGNKERYGKNIKKDDFWAAISPSKEGDA